MTNKEAIEECLKIEAFAVSEKQFNAMELAVSALKERPKGEWILQEVAICHGKVVPYEEVANYGYDSSLLCTCSVCGRNFYIDDDTELLIKYPYCHCGADMRGKANGKDSD
jgi:hypothetical protein